MVDIVSLHSITILDVAVAETMEHRGIGKAMILHLMTNIILWKYMHRQMKRRSVFIAALALKSVRQKKNIKELRVITAFIPAII